MLACCCWCCTAPCGALQKSGPRGASGRHPEVLNYPTNGAPALIGSDLNLCSIKSAPEQGILETHKPPATAGAPSATTIFSLLSVSPSALPSPNNPTGRKRCRRSLSAPGIGSLFLLDIYASANSSSGPPGTLLLMLMVDDDGWLPYPSVPSPSPFTTISALHRIEPQLRIFASFSLYPLASSTPSA